MTDVIRVQTLENSPDFDIVTGLAFNIFYHVRWVYMALPCILVFRSAIFLAQTIFRSRKHEMWKSNALALLFHGLSTSDCDALGPAPRIVDMEEAAKRCEVYTKGTAEGPKLVRVPALAQS